MTRLRSRPKPARPGGGPEGGRIVAAGPPEHVARDPGSVTGPWLAEHLGPPEDHLDGNLVGHSYQHD